MNWNSLQSGTDVRGTAVGEGITLTNQVAEHLGYAFACKIAGEKQLPVEKVKIALGRDSRISGEALLGAAADGIRKAGATALDFGLCTTPAMYMSIITPDVSADGSVMITASHHPWNKNGLKFFKGKGGLEGSEIETLLEKAETLSLQETPIKGDLIRQSFLPVYKQQLADRIRRGLNTEAEKPLDGLHIAVDAGNGAGGFYADLMESLGACISGSQYLDPDGHFPNHIPNPENPDAMKAIQQAVLSSGADLGVIFDADCDRAAIVDSDGKQINRNRLIALISAILLEEKPNQTIVTDSVTSSGLKIFIEAHGGEHYRFKRGYRNVIDEAIRLNGEGKNCPVAIETSGHAALQENHYLDDGMYLVTVLIVKAMQMKQNGKTLGSMIADLQEPLESREIRININSEDFKSTGQKAIDLVTKRAECDCTWHIAPDNREGIRISFDLKGEKDAGWLLLRLSVHDPVLPLNVESNVQGGVCDMLTALYGVLKDLDGIDLSGVRAALK